VRICVITNIESIHVKKILKYFVLKGHQVNVIGFDESEMKEIKYHRIKTPSNLKNRKIKYLWSLIATRKKVKKIAPDILLSIYFTGPGTTGALCNYHPHIVMALGSDVLIEMKQSLLYRIISKFTIYRTDRFVAVSKYIADTLCEEGVSKKDVFINPIGVDTRTFNYIEPKDKNENLQLVSTRKIDPNYNIKQFIDSLPIVYNNHNNLSVKITSSGSEFEQIKKSITNYGLGDKVSLTGHLPVSEMIEVIQKSIIFISVPFSDGAPVSLFEAMACGCFPILSDIPANRDWIKNGINGFLVPIGSPQILADKITEAINSPLLLNRARQINRKIVEENLNFTKLADNLINYLKSNTA
jgi:L-malate glycosyltransferase